MEKVLIGYISNTHSLKGDMILKSKHSKTEEILKTGRTIYIENNKFTLTKALPYKGNYLIHIDDLNDINLVENNIGKNVFIEKEPNEFFIEDLIGYKVISNNKEYGTVKSFIKTNTYILEIAYKKSYMIPYVDEFIIKIDNDAKKIYVKDVEELILWK